MGEAKRFKFGVQINTGMHDRLLSKGCIRVT